MNKIIGFLVLLFFFVKADAQDWKQLRNDNSVNFYDVVKAAEKHFDTKDKSKKGSGWKGYQRWVVENEYKFYPSGDRSQTDPFFVKNQYNQFASHDSKSNALVGWNELGPTSPGQITGHYAFGMGRIASFYVDPNNDQRLYIGSRTGGFWKSLDGGVTWAGGSTDFLAASGVNTIAASPTNPEAVLININNSTNHTSHGIYSSVDGGDTWSLSNFNPTNIGYGGLGTNFEIYTIKYHPTIPDLVFVGTWQGLYRSDDNLATWTRIETNTVITDIEFHPTNPDIVYMYDNYYWGANQNVVFYSTDQGLTFNTSNTLTGNNDATCKIDVSPDCPNCVYVASNNGLWKSTDSGVNYTLISNPSPSSAGFAVSDLDDNNILMGYVDAEMSTDGGLTFNQVTYWSLGNTNGAGSGNQVSYDTSTNYIHADVQEAKSINGVFYACTDGFLVKSADNGITWSILSEDIAIRMNYNLGVSQSNHDRTIVGSQDNGTSVNTENGWVEMYGADGMEGLIHPLNDDWMVGSWQNGGRIITHDAGQTKSTIKPGGEDGYWISPIFYDPNDHMKLYSLAENVYTSEDFGETWTNIGTPSFTGTVKFATIAENNSNIIVAAQDEKIELSTDGGVSWGDIKNNLPNYSITDVVFDPNDDNTIVVTYARYQTDNSKVFITHDQGATWQNITYNLGNMPVRSVVIDHTDTSTIYLGTEIGLYKKAMSDNTWSLYNTDLPNMSIKELEIMWGSNTIRASTWGRGLWEYDVFGRADYPSITTTEITNRPTIQSPKEGVDQLVTSTISYNGTLTSAHVEWSVDNPTFGNVIPMSNTMGDTWVSDTPLPDYPAGTKLYFKVFAVGDNGDTTETYKFMYTIEPFEYCVTSGESANGNLYISQVDVATMSNTSVNDAYTYYSGSLVELDLNQMYTIALSANTNWSNNDLGAWIDYNGDAEFDDSELIITEPGIGNFATANFIVPVTAKTNEELRMRIRLGYWDSPVFDPCGTTLGEVEDYPVMITNNILSNTDDYSLVDSTVHVSPNPASGQIQITSDVNTIHSVQLFDIRGRLILETSNNSNELTLDLGSLSSALYVISIKVGGATVVKKIVKQ